MWNVGIRASSPTDRRKDARPRSEGLRFAFDFGKTNEKANAVRTPVTPSTISGARHPNPAPRKPPRDPPPTSPTKLPDETMVSAVARVRSEWCWETNAYAAGRYI